MFYKRKPKRNFMRPVPVAEREVWAGQSTSARHQLQGRWREGGETHLRVNNILTSLRQLDGLCKEWGYITSSLHY